MYAAYASNLRECDHLLGEVTATLNRNTQQNRWTLIVTSDHWFRGRDWREAGKPLLAPAQRRTVPFYLLMGGESGAAYSTEKLSNSRVLRRLVLEAGDQSFDYAKARALIEAYGDAPTALRPF
jgi:arylsulfatase A-like enzyme